MAGQIKNRLDLWNLGCAVSLRLRDGTVPSIETLKALEQFSFEGLSDEEVTQAAQAAVKQGSYNRLDNCLRRIETVCTFLRDGIPEPKRETEPREVPSAPEKVFRRKKKARSRKADPAAG